MAKSTKELENTARRLKEMKVQVTPDGRPYLPLKDYLMLPGVKEQIRHFAASGLGKQLK